MSKILPVHPQPLKDEILSSWMVRLALSNGFVLHTFYRKILNYPNEIWTRDVDRMAPVSLLEILSRHTGQPINKIEELTLSRYTGYLYEKLNINGFSSWILPIGVYHRKRKWPVIQYCILCLREDHIPYFRIHWRLSLFSICEIHRCYLETECQFCGENVAYHRTGITNDRNSIPLNNFTLCWNCKKDLREGRTNDIEPKYKAYTKNYISVLGNFLDESFQKELNIKTYSLSLYFGMRCLASVIINRYSKGLRETIKNESILDLTKIKLKKFNHIEYLPLRDRFLLFLAVVWLIQEWPQRFLKIFKNNTNKKLLFSDCKNVLPYWIKKEMYLHFNTRKYVCNVDECLSVIRYLEKTGQKITIRNIVKFVGNRDDKRIVRQAINQHQDSFLL